MLAFFGDLGQIQAVSGEVGPSKALLPGSAWVILWSWVTELDHQIVCFLVQLRAARTARCVAVHREGAEAARLVAI